MAKLSKIVPTLLDGGIAVLSNKDTGDKHLVKEYPIHKLIYNNDGRLTGGERPTYSIPRCPQSVGERTDSLMHKLREYTDSIWVIEDRVHVTPQLKELARILMKCPYKWITIRHKLPPFVDDDTPRYESHDVSITSPTPERPDWHLHHKRHGSWVIYHDDGLISIKLGEWFEELLIIALSKLKLNIAGRVDMNLLAEEFEIPDIPTPSTEERLSYTIRSEKPKNKERIRIRLNTPADVARLVRIYESESRLYQIDTNDPAFDIHGLVTDIPLRYHVPKGVVF